MITVYCLDISQISQEQYEGFYLAASEERQEKADRCRMPEDKVRCVISDLLLKRGVKNWQNTETADNCIRISEKLQIAIGEKGKPYIQNIPGFFYNLSHSGNWVVLAFGDHEVGVDVEKVREEANLEKIARRFFTEQERKYIFEPREEKDRRLRFTRIWTCKESYVKYLGIGLAKGLDSFSVDGEMNGITEEGVIVENLILNSWMPEENYYVTVCMEQDKVDYQFLTVEQLKD